MCSRIGAAVSTRGDGDCLPSPKRRWHRPIQPNLGVARALINGEKPYTATLEGVSTVMTSTPPGPHRQQQLTPGYPARSCVGAADAAFGINAARRNDTSTHIPALSSFLPT